MGQLFSNGRWTDPLVFYHQLDCSCTFSCRYVDKTRMLKSIFHLTSNRYSGVLAMIIIRTLRRDIAQYNKEEDDLEDALEETGWKLVHGDVFRPPKLVSSI